VSGRKVPLDYLARVDLDMLSQLSPGSRPAIIALMGRTAVGKSTLIATLAKSLDGNDFQPMDAVRGFAELFSDWIRPERPEPALEGPFDRQSVIIQFSDDDTPSEITNQLADRDLAVTIVLVDVHDTELPAEVVKRSAVIDSVAASRPPIRLLVVTKSDDSLEPSHGLLDDLSHRYNFKRWFVTSAMDGTGIQELRTGVLEAIGARAARDEPEDDVVRIVRTMTDALCELIAAQPDALNRVEWRELERVIARALEKIGFDVELTPSGKDGGKDVVATCIAHNHRMLFYIEVKHWRDDRPGLRHVADFVQVNAFDRTDGGLFLSSSGFANAVHTRLAEISSQNVRLGQRDKIVHLCRQFVQRAAGPWSPTSPLPVLLFEETLT
jgi:hypothetical protein